MRYGLAVNIQYKAWSHIDTNPDVRDPLNLSYCDPRFALDWGRSTIHSGRSWYLSGRVHRWACIKQETET